ncbi:pyridoxal-dependent decarboxylase [Corynebacterium camporealensis]|uniref:aspartate aminotransferase family protein n=1 Tax=Corynebacterium camporealensis TaxID=161896 RepID=UPI0034CEEEB5
MPKPLNKSHLVGSGETPADFLSAVQEASTCAAQHLYADSPPCQDFQDAITALHDVDFRQPCSSFSDCLSELEELWLKQAVFYHHPRYISHLNCQVAIPAVAAEVLASSLNTAVESWDQAGPAAAIEQKLIRWAADLVGFGQSAQGVFTTGGTQSNLQALTVARNQALQELQAQGYSHFEALSKLRILCTPSAHYSIARGVELLGLSPDSIVEISEDFHGQMRPLSLEASLREVCRAGKYPAAVICTAGSTDRGSIDPLSEVIDIAHHHDVPVHVDAAYGGAGLLGPESASLFYGIEKADSVTLDFHKGFYQPVACSCVLFAEGQRLEHIRWNASYLNPAESSRPNLADISLHTTRRFDALKLWVTLRTIGQERIGASFDTCCALARRAAALVDDFPKLQLWETPQLSTVLFELQATESADSPHPAEYYRIRDELFDSGQAAVAVTEIHGTPLFKFTILDPTLRDEDIQSVLNAIVRAHSEALIRTR